MIAKKTIKAINWRPQDLPAYSTPTSILSIRDFNDSNAPIGYLFYWINSWDSACSYSIRFALSKLFPLKIILTVLAIPFIWRNLRYWDAFWVNEHREAQVRHKVLKNADKCTKHDLKNSKTNIFTICLKVATKID